MKVSIVRANARDRPGPWRRSRRRRGVCSLIVAPQLHCYLLGPHLMFGLSSAHLYSLSLPLRAVPRCCRRSRSQRRRHHGCCFLLLAHNQRWRTRVRRLDWIRLSLRPLERAPPRRQQSTASSWRPSIISIAWPHLSRSHLSLFSLALAPNHHHHQSMASSQCHLVSGGAHKQYRLPSWQQQRATSTATTTTAS